MNGNRYTCSMYQPGNKPSTRQTNEPINPPEILMNDQLMFNNALLEGGGEAKDSFITVSINGRIQ